MGVLWYVVALLAEGKHLIVVQGNLNAQGYINQILQPEAVLSFKGMGMQYWFMIMQGLVLQGYVDSF